MIDVPLGSAVTALAKSSGEQRIPQPSNRRASLHRRVTHAQWFRSSSTKAANRGFAPDAADVFNGTSIKANSAFMLAPLIPQPPLTKGTSAAIQHNVKELCAVVLASRRQTAPRTLSRLRIIYIMCKWPQPPRCGFNAAASRKGCLTIARQLLPALLYLPHPCGRALTPRPPTCWSTKAGSHWRCSFPALAAHHPSAPKGLPKLWSEVVCLLLVVQCATVLNQSRLNHASVAQATLTDLRAMTLRND
jgi:hypothetical protein